MKVYIYEEKVKHKSESPVREDIQAKIMWYVN
jgi:hypothetical protein